MTKINLNNFLTDTNDKIIFNNGDAGRVKNVRMEISKKQPTDADNAPDFKLFFYDQAGGVVNKGYYYPTEETSPKKIQIEVSQLVSFLKVLRPELDTKTLPEFQTNKQVYEFLAKEIATSDLANTRFNVFVSYGTEGNPSQYLGFRAYEIVEPLNTPDDRTRLTPKNSQDPDRSKYNDNMSRVKPTDFEEGLTDTSPTEEGEKW